MNNTKRKAENEIIDGMRNQKQESRIKKQKSRNHQKKLGSSSRVFSETLIDHWLKKERRA
ncbi:hypothetical protein EX87_10135 [Brevibacillus laterosporus]|uniref:Uncharacterized protein n=1 Tax=Brevibacillus laterosporus TaxID=1465 RepID=A0A0F7BZL1_BRELA|nr:hypothetical protein EX87_10135 [Brevibacillus laterosporus]